MSKHAQALASATPTPTHVKRGPDNLCFPLYGAGDLEDWEAIEAFRKKPNETWKTTQAQWDDIIGIPPEQRILNDKFRYHWRRRCFCWPVELRLP